MTIGRRGSWCCAWLAAALGPLTLIALAWGSVRLGLRARLFSGLRTGGYSAVWAVLGFSAVAVATASARARASLFALGGLTVGCLCL